LSFNLLILVFFFFVRLVLV